jgi:hypothetical protein
MRQVMRQIGSRLSPAMIVALLALFVALSGTAVAAGIVPLAKRALVADNAKKVGGSSLAQLTAAAQQAGSQPGPASTANALITIKTAPWSLGGGAQNNFTTPCDAGQKAISGGFDNPSGDALGLDTRPTADDSGWQLFLVNLSSSAGASGTLFVVCLK